MPNFTEEEDYLIASFVLKHGNKLSYKGTRLFKEMEGSKVRARGCWTKAHTDAAEGGSCRHLRVSRHSCVTCSFHSRAWRGVRPTLCSPASRDGFGLLRCVVPRAASIGLAITGIALRCSLTMPGLAQQEELDVIFPLPVKGADDVGKPPFLFACLVA